MGHFHVTVDMAPGFYGDCIRITLGSAMVKDGSVPPGSPYSDRLRTHSICHPEFIGKMVAGCSTSHFSYRRVRIKRPPRIKRPSPSSASTSYGLRM